MDLESSVSTQRPLSKVHLQIPNILLVGADAVETCVSVKVFSFDYRKATPERLTMTEHSAYMRAECSGFSGLNAKRFLYGFQYAAGHINTHMPPKS